MDMEQDLISKKDLLELTNISYGQLYRWKRKGLIPEDWFIKKSSYTGQETFFPRSPVLSRIEKIKDMKEDISLDDLANIFSPALSNLCLDARELSQRNMVSSETMNLFLDRHKDRQLLSFQDILAVWILNKFLIAGDISLDEGRNLLDVLEEGLLRFAEGPSELYLLRKLGVFICFAVSPPCQICLDKNTRLISKTNVNTIIEELNLKLI